MVAVVSDVALSRAVVTIEDGTGELRDAGARGKNAPETFRAAGHDGGFAVEAEGRGRGAHLARDEG